MLHSVLIWVLANITWEVLLVTAVCGGLNFWLMAPGMAQRDYHAEARLAAITGLIMMGTSLLVFLGIKLISVFIQP